MLDPAIERRFENVSKSKTFRNMVELFGLGHREVLDIGCSYGEFLSHFGPGSVGITIIEDEVAYAANKNLDVRFGNIEDDTFVLDKKFDVAFANNIFEHLYSPHEFLRRVRNYLKPEGVLILGVPCIPKLVFLLRFRKFRGSLAGAHINFFTRDTLIKTVEQGGWRLHMVRGFRFKNGVVDGLLNLIYPHFYAVASIDPGFSYTKKRMRELVGYRDIVQ